ncbi:DNA glycosylase [Mycotypha africana]|uniref:DNA glycosylase n=1 Tax=Mycotypha africana TaxID=64632 RepID=UPI0023011728|nr:DNA glycosylase [Mycotypha africana]KAI8981886.1 DNA glycosylase [Mycotypha africana]
MTEDQTLIDIENCVLSKRLYHSDQYHRVNDTEKQAIQKDLLDWYHKEKRTNMPWRKDSDKTWNAKVFEEHSVNLATVIAYYNRWMEAFPTINDLAAADIEKVNKLWAGLGYYSRAKRLWEGAQKVVNDFEGLLPNNAKELEKNIPGVGRYTAGAIASIVYGERTPVVDGNVIRVLSRWRAIHADPKKAKTVDLLWTIAGDVVAESNPGDFNQAMMELGARICTPQNPDCEKCPIKNNCRAYRQYKLSRELLKGGFFDKNAKKRRQLTTEHGCSICPEIEIDLGEKEYSVTRYPLKLDKKPARDEQSAVTIIERVLPKDQEPIYLISKRPKTGLLAGLWEFPTLELNTLDTTYAERKVKASTFLRNRYGLNLEEEGLEVNRYDLGNVVHLFSHIRKVYHIEWIQFRNPVDENVTIDTVKQTTDALTDIKWVTMAELKVSAIPTGLKKAIKLLEKHKTTTSTSLTKKKTVVKKAGTIKTADISSFFTLAK